MEADERRAVGGLPADDQRDVFAQVVGAAEGDDLGLFVGGERQARARGDLQGPRIAQRRGILDRDRDRLARRHGRDEEGRQDPGEQRQLHRRLGLGPPAQRIGAERALERRGEIERRVGDRARRGEVERLGSADQHRGVRIGCLALVGELEGRRARCGDQRQLRGALVAGRGLNRQQRRSVAYLERPSMAQRVDRLSRPSGR